MPDITALIVGLSRIQSDLRFVDAHPAQYPSDGHYERVVNLMTVLQGEVLHWMRQGDTAERRQETRRQGEDRRHAADRRHLERTEVA